MKRKYHKFNKWLRNYIDFQVEYETSNIDAGDNYCHCVVDQYEYQGGDRAFTQWMAENGIDSHGIDSEILMQHILDFDLFEMKEGSIFGVYKFSESQGFTMASFPIQEIEISIELSTIENDFGKHGKKLWNRAVNDNEFCLRGNMDGKYPCGYAYEYTDSAWFAVIEKEVIESAISELVEEMEIS